MLAPFINQPADLTHIVFAVNYGLIATGFPEELLFRGLIAGVCFRRVSFWKANVLQAASFVAPHLLILLVAPNLWFFVIAAALALGLIAGWLRFKSGSIVPSTLVHATGNISGALVVLNW